MHEEETLQEAKQRIDRMIDVAHKRVDRMIDVARKRVAWEHVYEMREICNAHQRLYGIPYGPVKPATYVVSSRDEWWRVTGGFYRDDTSYPTFDAAYKQYMEICDNSWSDVPALMHVEVIARRYPKLAVEPPEAWRNGSEVFRIPDYKKENP